MVIKNIYKNYLSINNYRRYIVVTTLFRIRSIFCCISSRIHWKFPSERMVYFVPFSNRLYSQGRKSLNRNRTRIAPWRINNGPCDNEWISGNMLQATSPFSHFIHSNVSLVFLFFRPFASPFQRMSETWRTDVFTSMKSQLAFRDYVSNDIDRAPFLNRFISSRFTRKIVRTYLRPLFLLLLYIYHISILHKIEQ